MEEHGDMEERMDGRNLRWENHRIEKRRELVDATLRAIRTHGPGVGLDEIAATAGTSKTVIYRHFGDRTGLFVAVVESVHDYILSNLNVPLTLTEHRDPASLVADLTDAYLAVVERDPEIYRFVISRPLADVPVDDPVGSFTTRIGDLVAESMRAHLIRTGGDPEAALTWGHGVVGFIWAIADKWLATDMRRPRADIVRYVGDLFTPAFATESYPTQARRQP